MMIDMSVSPRALSEVAASGPIEKSAAPVSRETPHRAAERSAPATTPAGSIELIKPTQNFNPATLGKVASELDTTVELMVLLFRIAQKARELGVLQRDSENTAIIEAQKSQVTEMRSGANLMIAMAVISGIMAVGTAIIGAVGASKNGKAIKQEGQLEKSIAGRNELIDAKMQSLGKTSDADRKTVGAVWEQAQAFDSELLTKTGRKIDTRNTTYQAMNSVNQSLGQMANTSVQVRQGHIQANAKEDEVEASIAQSRKQIVDEQLSYNSNSMKELIQTLHELSQNYVAAWKAAAAIV